jgi:CRISPR-associated protein Cmr4
MGAAGMSERTTRIYWLHALTPMHIGAGRGEGYIDLPLAREQLTKYPYVPGSSVKGVFAEACGATDEKRRTDTLLQAAFGRAGDDASNAGALAFTDARLVCLPVPSLYGTFAWCTCPFVLTRLQRDLQAAGLDPRVPPPQPTSGFALTTDKCKLSIGPDAPKAYLLDLEISVKSHPGGIAWGQMLAEWLFPNEATWQTLFMERFLIVDDDTFSFLATTATEVQPHIRIEAEQKRVADGALWYEESLPAETILAGLVWCDRVYGVAGIAGEDVLGLCSSKTGAEAVQIGGKASVGKGLTELRFT